jgi:hypothetical protein
LFGKRRYEENDAIFSRPISHTLASPAQWLFPPQPSPTELTSQLPINPHFTNCKVVIGNTTMDIGSTSLSTEVASASRLTENLSYNDCKRSIECFHKIEDVSIANPFLEICNYFFLPFSPSIENVFE